MRVLFIHQNYPGQFPLIADALSKRTGYQIVGLGEAEKIEARNARFPYSVVGYVPRQSDQSGIHHYLEGFQQAIRRGQDVVRACQKIRAGGFYPDVIIGHPAWGELLFIKDVFPNSRLISYFEFFYHAVGADVGLDPEFPPNEDSPFKLRIRNSVQLHALSACDDGISATYWQRSTYPERDQKRIHVIHEGINTERLASNASASYVLPDGNRLDRSHQVVTFVSRNLEPYRGFHTFMRALPNLQKALPRAHFVIIGADAVSYGSLPEAPHKNWREKMLAEVGDQLDLSRTHFVGKLPYADYVSLLQISRLHIYLTYPFVLSWSMLEAMACGAPVLASNTAPVREVIRHGENGHLFDFFDQESLVAQAVELINSDSQDVVDCARHDIRKNYSFSENGLVGYLQLLEQIGSDKSVNNESFA